MALILAVNPGGIHNSALARLARELPGHELIGADSCAVAITAVDRRAPDLVLLPPLPASEKAELLARLRTVPGAVRTLKLTPLTLDDLRLFVDFADRVRESLAAPPEASPGRLEERLHLIAAAAALAAWVRARRVTWSDAVTAGSVNEARVPARETAAREAAVKTTTVPRAIAEPADQTTDDEATEPGERAPEPRVEVAPRDWSAWREPIRRWLPRIAALAVVVALAALALIYGPNLRTSFGSGVLVLESGPAGSQVFIDGRLAGTTPTSVELPAGQHSVEFRNGSMSRTTEVAVVARSRVIQRVDWMATPAGSLEVRSDPTGARVLVDGAARGTTPLTLDTIEAGTHVVTIESQAGSVRRTVTIAAGQATQLTESIFAGWLAVFAPFEIEMTEGSGLIRPDDRGRTMLPAGSHTLRFRNSDLGYDETRTVEIAPGETATLNLTPQTTISITATEPSEVSIDGKPVGQTPVANLRIGLGLRLVVVTPATGERREFTVTATAKPVRIDVDFSKPQA